MTELKNTSQETEQNIEKQTIEASNAESNVEQKRKSDWQKKSLIDKVRTVFVFTPLLLIGVPLLFLSTGPLFIVSAFTDEMSNRKKVLYALVGILLIVALVFVILGLKTFFGTY